MFLGLLSLYEGGNAGAPISPTAQAPSGTASHPKRFVLPHDMSKAARILAGDHDALLIVEAIVTSGVLQ